MVEWTDHFIRKIMASVSRTPIWWSTEKIIYPATLCRLKALPWMQVCCCFQSILLLGIYAHRGEGGGLLNTLGPRRNEQHFADDIFIRIFFNGNVWISIKISLKFVPKGPINNIPALVQIMQLQYDLGVNLFTVETLPFVRTEPFNDFFSKGDSVMNIYIVCAILNVLLLSPSIYCDAFS